MRTLGSLVLCLVFGSAACPATASPVLLDAATFAAATRPLSTVVEDFEGFSLYLHRPSLQLANAFYTADLP